MKKIIGLLKIILAISAVCSISLGVYLYVHANDGTTDHLFPLTITMNAFITLILVLIFTVEKRIGQSNRLDTVKRK